MQDECPVATRTLSGVAKYNALKFKCQRRNCEKNCG